MTVDGLNLRAFVEHHESLEADRKTAAEDQAQLLADTVEQGFDKKALKRLIRRLRRDAAEVTEEHAIDEAYYAAYMDFESTPLGAAAKERSGDDTNVTIRGGGEVIETTIVGLREMAEAARAAR